MIRVPHVDGRFVGVQNVARYFNQRRQHVVQTQRAVERLVGAVQRFELLQALLRFGVYTRVLDSHRGSVCQRQQHALLFTCQRALLAVIDAEHAKDLAIDCDRHVQQGSNALDIGDAVRHPRIVGHVLHGDGLAALCNPRGDAFASRMRHLGEGLRPEPARRTGDQLLVALVPHQYRRHVGFQHI